MRAMKFHPLKMLEIRAMEQLMIAGSANWLALTFFWIAERSPGVSESLAKGAMVVYSRRTFLKNYIKFKCCLDLRANINISAIERCD